MATRMQQRRGTASQWISTNQGNGPILSAGEIGFESDTNKFKIGDGINHWVDLTYFTDAESITTALNSIIDGAPAALNTLNELAAALGDDANFLASLATEDYVDTAIGNIDALPAQSTNGGKFLTTDGSTASWATVDLTSKQDVVANVSSTEIGYLDGVTSGIQGQLDNKLESSDLAGYATETYVDTAIGNAEVDQSELAGEGLEWNATTSQFDVGTLISPTISTGLTLDGTGDFTISADANIILDATTEVYIGSAASGNEVATKSYTDSAVSTHSSDTTSVHGISDTSKVVLTNAASTTLDGALIVDGDFTVNGTNFSASATSITIEDNLLQLAHQNAANTVDLGLVVGYNDGTAKHAGLVKDTSANTWKLFKDVTTEPTTTVDFTQGSLDDLQLNSITASSITVGDVSNTEFGYLNGVTSGIQSQIDLKAPIANPTFTGTVSGVTKAHVGLGNVDNTSDANKPVSTATQTALDLKANLAGPTFTGNVVLPSTTSIGNVSATEIGYVDGVTSAIQTQLDSKIAKADITAKGVILVGTGSGTYTAQSVGTNGQVLTANSAQTDGVEWTTISGYSAPTLGSTSIASGATVTTIAGLTLTAPTLTGTVTASGDINLSAAGGPGSVIDELTLLLMGAL